MADDARRLYSDAVPQPELLHWSAELRQRVEELIDEYRVALFDALNGLTEQEARRQLVPSKTTLLGLVKHMTFVEGVWFDQAITGRSYEEIGIPGTVDGSFTLSEGDSVATVQTSYRDRCERSRDNVARLRSDDVVNGRGARPVWALQLRSSASSRSTPATPTSCENRFSRDDHPDRHRRTRCPDNEPRFVRRSAHVFTRSIAADSPLANVTFAATD